VTVVAFLNKQQIKPSTNF